jgi:hypothetical protein
MKITFISGLIALFAASVKGQSCPIFSCGNIEQTTEGVRMCVKEANSTAEASAYQVDGCRDQEVCKAVEWQTIADVQATAICVNNTTPIPEYPEIPEFKENVALDGSFCHNTTMCFNHELGVECVNSACKTNVTIGANCTSHRECPANSYCGAGDVCTVVPAVGGNCTEFKICAHNQECVSTVEPYENFTCVSSLSLKEGATFVHASTEQLSSKVSAANDLEENVMLDLSCETGYSFTVDAEKKIVQCRKGDRSDDQTLEALRRNEAGDNCTFVTFNDPDPANFTVAVNQTDYAKCGFNKDGYAWCSLRTGDTEVMKAITGFVNKVGIDDKTCHPLEEDSICNALLTRLKSKESLRFNWALQQVAGAFPNVANNDKCVAESITAVFWAGRYEDNAMGLSVLSAFGVFTFIFALLY